MAAIVSSWARAAAPFVLVEQAFPQQRRGQAWRGRVPGRDRAAIGPKKRGGFQMSADPVSGRYRCHQDPRHITNARDLDREFASWKRAFA
jgi:hypothetical protein